MKHLPGSLRQFVEKQTTLPVADLWKIPEDYCSPYGSYWCRAVLCILLSGRVSAKYNGFPNMTDVNRVGKEANFNQYLVERIGKLLVAARVIQSDYRRPYEPGPNLEFFWDHDVKVLPKIIRQAILELVQSPNEFRSRRDPTTDSAHRIDFLTLFFTCFKGLALRQQDVGKAMYAFATLPATDLVQAAKACGLQVTVNAVRGWEGWLNDNGQKDLLSALYLAEWMYYDERNKVGWVFASPTGWGMLDLEKVPPAPELSTDLKALTNLSVFAGAGLALEKLLPLFRLCKIKRIDQVCEFQLDPKRLAQMPSKTSAGEELQRVFHELEQLPPTIASLLETKSNLGGVIRIRGCCALVKPENEEMLAAIRQHPRLKNYLEPGAPPGYLLIKPQSDPHNFIRRCQQLGFEVKQLEG